MTTPTTDHMLDEFAALLRGNRDLDWMDDGLCKETDPEMFFPPSGLSAADARKVCAECPVATRCLEYALTHNETFGVWGGVSERDRRKLKRGGAQPRRCAECQTRGVTGRYRYCEKCREKRQRETQTKANLKRRNPNGVAA